jgi:hypothetical protein
MLDYLCWTGHMDSWNMIHGIIMTYLVAPFIIWSLSRRFFLLLQALTSHIQIESADGLKMSRHGGYAITL